MFLLLKSLELFKVFPMRRSFCWNSQATTSTKIQFHSSKKLFSFVLPWRPINSKQHICLRHAKKCWNLVFHNIFSLRNNQLFRLCLTTSRTLVICAIFDIVKIEVTSFLNIFLNWNHIILLLTLSSLLFFSKNIETLRYLSTQSQECFSICTAVVILICDWNRCRRSIVIVIILIKRFFVFIFGCWYSWKVVRSIEFIQVKRCLTLRLGVD